MRRKKKVSQKKKSKTISGKADRDKRAKDKDKEKNQWVFSLAVIIGAAILGWLFGSYFLGRYF